MPLAVDFEHSVEGNVSVRSRRYRGLGGHPGMVMASVREGVAGGMRMRLARGLAEQPERQCAIVQEPVTQIGVLRSGPRRNCKDVSVKAKYRRQTLAEGHAKQSVPRARSRLEFRLKPLAKRVDKIRGTRRCLDAEQHGRLRSTHLIVQKSILAKQSYISKTRCIAT